MKQRLLKYGVDLHYKNTLVLSQFLKDLKIFINTGKPT